jgi:hypothetical protein
MRESQRILQESTGNRWNIEAVFQPEIFRIFPVDSYKLPVLSDRNRPKIIGKIRKISGRNTASTKSPKLPGAGCFRAGMFDLGI